MATQAQQAKQTPVFLSVMMTPPPPPPGTVVITFTKTLITFTKNSFYFSASEVKANHKDTIYALFKILSQFVRYGVTASRMVEPGRC